MPRKHKTPEASTGQVQTQVQVYQPLSKPENLPSEAICLTPGTKVKYHSKKQNKDLERTVTGLQIRLPKVTEVMAAKGLTEAQAKDRIAAIAKAIKPAVSGRVNQAMASDTYGIRSYSESKAGALSVSLYPVNVSDMAASISAQTGLSLEEVYKRMPELKPKPVLEVKA